MTQTTTVASHRKGNSVQKPSGRKLKTMAKLGKEAKEASAKTEYESYGAGKAEAIREKRLAGEQQEVYVKDKG